MDRLASAIIGVAFGFILFYWMSAA